MPRWHISVNVYLNCVLRAVAFYKRLCGIGLIVLVASCSGGRSATTVNPNQIVPIVSPTAAAGTTYQISSSPPHLSVFVDSTYLGVTPVSFVAPFSNSAQSISILTNSGLNFRLNLVETGGSAVRRVIYNQNVDVSGNVLIDSSQSGLSTERAAVNIRKMPRLPGMLNAPINGLVYVTLRPARRVESFKSANLSLADSKPLSDRLGGETFLFRTTEHERAESIRARVLNEPVPISRTLT